MDHHHPRIRPAGAMVAAIVLGACSGGAPQRSIMTPPSTVATSVAGGEAPAPSEESMPHATAAPVSAAGRTLVGTVVTPHTSDAAHDSGREPVTSDARPMLIYVADVTLIVERLTETADRAIEIATGAGGFLASRSDTSVQLRVPASRFRELLAQLEHLGDVSHQQIAAEDVSEQFHDLEIQLTNLRAMRERMEDFLRRANNVSEALLVEHELERISSQIDQIEGRMRFLSARAAFSTITLNLVRREVIELHPHPQPDDQPALPFSWLDTLGLPNLVRLR